VSRRDIDPDALRVLYRLKECGHTAYLVGGGVRDLLLGRRPKDFDVSTDAHPREIKRLFRNCFLIGRRFRLAHIKFGNRIIETSTFRRAPEVAPAGDPGPDEPRHRHDNTFGTPEEDAWRRDFTINGLFYDIRTFHVIDHVGGLADLEAGIIRSIGDPNVRFVEDPVRMVRAVRFAARFGFRIEDGTYAAMLRHAEEIAEAAPARVLEEMYRLYGYGSAADAFRMLYRTRLLRVLAPEVECYLTRSQDASRDPLWRYVEASDAGGETHGDLAPVIRLGGLFYALFLDRLRSSGGVPDHVTAHAHVAAELLRSFSGRYRLPRAVHARLVNALSVQHRFAVQDERWIRRCAHGHDLFRDAAALHAVHVAASGAEAGMDGWAEYRAEPGREAGAGLRHERPWFAGVGPDGEPRRRRRRRRGSRGRRQQTRAEVVVGQAAGNGVVQRGSG
jgi:poly(A) polymerase